MMEIKGGIGALPCGSGYSAEPEPEGVSAVPVSIPNAAVASMNDYIALAGSEAKTLMVSPPSYDELRANSDPRDWVWYHGRPALYRGALVNVHDEWSWGWMVRKADGSFVGSTSGMEARQGGNVPATYGSLKNTTAGGTVPSSDDSPTGEAGDAQGTSQ